MKSFTRITVDPNQMGGLPCIRSLRIPVATVVGMVGEGMAEAEILNAYPDLEVEDVREALRYAAEAVRERELPVVGGSSDFGTLLALRNEEKPSVILLRRGPKRPAIQLRLLLGAMPVMEGPLSEGSIIVVEEKRIRVRRLPLGR